MKQETLKEAAERILWDNTGMLIENHPTITKSMIDLAKWQQEQDNKMYSEEDMKSAYEQGARLALLSQSPLALHNGEFPNPEE